MVLNIDLSDTVRHLSFLATLSVISFLIAVFSAPVLIRFLKKFSLKQQIREDSVDGRVAKLFRKLHLKKSGTPTMGGVLIWGTTIVVVILSRIFSLSGFLDKSLLNRKETYLPIFTLIVVALLGLIDDYLNVKGVGAVKGIKVKPKMFWLTLFASLGAWWFYFKLGYSSIYMPFLGDFPIGWLYIPLFVLVIISTANAVNFTDGLDGLAGGLLVLAFLCFGIIAFAKGLLILAAFCGVIVGALLAFLWFNIPPASFYMGDTGSLSLGATLGVIAMLTDSVVVLPLIGFIFVIETLSVIIQLFSKKFFKKKVFHIAPIHHHFEYKGWPETLVTLRFWIIGGFVASFGLIVRLLGLL